MDEHEPYKQPQSIEDLREPYLKKLKNPAPSVEDEVQDLFKIQLQSAQRMYSTVYHGITVELHLSPIESLVFSTILALSKKRGYAFAGQKLYSYLLNVTQTTINTTLKRLQKKGFIEKLPKKGPAGTTCWKLTTEYAEKVQYLQKQIKDSKSEKRTK